MPKNTTNNRNEQGLGKLPSPANRTNLVRSMLNASRQELELERNTEAFNVPIEKLVVNPKQPRQKYNEEQEQELAESVRANGILQPLVVRKNSNDTYQIVIGERRYHAAKKVGLAQVPVVLKQFNDREARLASIIENVQRSDLDPLDEANYYQYLIDELNLSQNEVADFVHRSRSYIQSKLRLLNQETTDNSLDDEAKVTTTPEVVKKQPTLSLKTNDSKKLLTKKYIQKPITRFSVFLDEALDQLPTIAPEDKEFLSEQVKELRAKLALLEHNLKS